jgi:regulator of cell morphogenesis and NO signaling
MNDLRSLPTDAQLARIVERFHEGHRRDLAVLIEEARALDAAGATPAVAQAVAALAEALEQHMFKEEARLFPMMEQGGNAPIGQLIDAMRAEHREHEDRVAALQAQVDELTKPAAAAAIAAQFRAAIAALLAELADHVRAEDEILFPRFELRVPCVVGRTASPCQGVRESPSGAAASPQRRCVAKPGLPVAGLPAIGRNCDDVDVGLGVHVHERELERPIDDAPSHLRVLRPGFGRLGGRRLRCMHRPFEAFCEARTDCRVVLNLVQELHPGRRVKAD